MPIVSSTATLTLKAQKLKWVRRSKFRYINDKNLRRKRKCHAFHNVILKMPGSSIVILVYASGKCVILGSRDVFELEMTTAWLSDTLKSDVLVRPKISNYVFTFTLSDTRISLTVLYEAAKQKYKENASRYNPEISPALIFHPQSSPGSTAMIFSSGKVTITGLKDKEVIQTVCEEIIRLYRDVQSDDVQQPQILPHS